MRITAGPLRRVHLTRRLGALLAGVLLCTGMTVLLPPPGQATLGIDDYPARLKNAAQDALVDPWLFYNRECTSFVAWRINNDTSVPFHNYYLGKHWGNASNWKYAAQSAGVLVDNTPTVGSIAWWAKGSPGSSSGHVAFVLSVGTSSITVEEYNYVRRGYYDTRIITTDSTKWPGGFIHLGDVDLKNTRTPEITGPVKVGARLTADPGTWSPAGTGYQYQWLAAGAAIARATDRTYRVKADQLGKQLRVQVTATRTGLSSKTVTSPASVPVAPGTLGIAAVPTVTGEARVGVQLSADAGRFRPASSTTIQWYTGRQAIAGATEDTFTPTADQLGRTVRVKVTASRKGYAERTVRSQATARVQPGELTVRSAPVIVGTPQVGAPVSVSSGTWSSDAELSYQWVAGQTPIPGATDATYTPTADELSDRLRVTVTASRLGYTTGSATTAPSTPVVEGSFDVADPPRLSAPAKVGVPITLSPGLWSPTPNLTNVWLVDDKVVRSATGTSFTPRVKDVGKAVTARVEGTAAGYRTGTAATQATAPVALGDITSTAAPTMLGEPFIGETLEADVGTWSVPEADVSYRWLRDGDPIRGAKAATYDVRKRDLGARITLSVTAARTGYRPTTVVSEPTETVRAGRVTLGGKPTLTGRRVLGETLRVNLPGLTPAQSTVRYRWFRGAQRLSGQRGDSYSLRTADLGRRIHVEVEATLDTWAPTARRSTATRRVRSVPQLSATLVEGRKHPSLSVRVKAPGLRGVSGVVRVLKDGERVRRVPITAGRGEGVLRLPGRGAATVELVYRWPQVTMVARQTLRVPARLNPGG